MAIRIAPKTPGTVFIFDIFIKISAVPIGMLFRDTVDHMLDANAAVQSMVEDVVTTVHGKWPWWRMTDYRNWY